jgi:hypothetical protein
MSRVSVVVCLITLALVTQCKAARADLPEGCTELGLGLTEHTCFHARFGPFEERSADPGEQADNATANIDPEARRVASSAVWKVEPAGRRVSVAHRATLHDLASAPPAARSMMTALHDRPAVHAARR